MSTADLGEQPRVRHDRGNESPSDGDVGEFGGASGSDAELLELARRRDHTATAQLYHRYRAYAFTVAYRTGYLSEHDASDAVAEAWSGILRQLSRGGGPSEDLRPYLARCVRNSVIDQWNRNTRDALADTRYLDDALRTHEPPDPLTEAVERLSPLPTSHLLALALADLSPAMRALLTRAILQEIPTHALAVELGTTPSVAASRLYRARTALRRRYLHHLLLSTLPPEHGAAMHP